MDVEQDGKIFRPISEGKMKALLQKAEKGELILYAPVLPHTAILHATPFAKITQPETDRITGATFLVPLNMRTISALLYFPDVSLESYLAADPSIYAESHPHFGHIYWLKEPQTVTRALTYFRLDDENVRGIDAPAAKVEAGAVTTPGDDGQPWLARNPKDPNPDYHWYTPARYFARQLVKDDSTLLTKKNLLAKKISASLAGVGIFKRGGKNSIADTTILKALVKVTLS